MANGLTWWKAAILGVRGGKLRRASWTVDPLRWITHRTGLWLYHEEENPGLGTDAVAATVPVPRPVHNTEFTAGEFNATDWTDEDAASNPTTPPDSGGGGTGGGDPPGGIGPITPPDGGGGSGGGGGTLPAPPTPPGADPGPPGGPPQGGAGSGDGSVSPRIPIPLPGPGPGPGGGSDDNKPDDSTPTGAVVSHASWRTPHKIINQEAVTNYYLDKYISAVFHAPAGTTWSITGRHLSTGIIHVIGTSSNTVIDETFSDELHLTHSDAVTVEPVIELRATCIHRETGVVLDADPVSIFFPPN